MVNEKEKKTKIQIIAESLYKVKDSKDDFLKVFRFFCILYFKNSHALFTYPGSKKKMIEELNDVFDKLHLEKHSITSKGYDTFIDLFGGGANSTIALLDSLKLGGCKEFIFNDIDKCVYSTHLNCKEKPEEMISEFSEFIRTNFIKPYKTVFLSNEIYNKIIAPEIDEFYRLQTNKDYGVPLSIRFMLFRELSYSGTLKYRSEKDGGGHQFTKKVYDMSRATSEIFRIIPKIMKFSELYNKHNIKFYNEDAFDLLQTDKFKDLSHTLINLDPPYVDEMKEDIDEEKLKVMTSEELKDCTIDYNIQFNHIALLESLSSMNFIYNNNRHPIVEFYANKINASYETFNRNECISSKKDKKNKTVEEYIVYNNSTIHPL